MKNFYTLCIALALALTTGLATTTVTAQPRSIDFCRAEQIARQAVAGAQVRSIELDHERGITVYEVELRSADGVKHEVIIDARDGRVIRTRIDH